MTESSIVQAFIDLAIAMPNATEDDLSQGLQRSGIEIGLAERAIVFVPMACARVVLKGAKFPEEFELRDPVSGRKSRGRFSEEPIFVAALAAAEKLGASDARVVMIASRSAEMNVARKLMGPDSRPSDIGFVEPIVMRIPLGPASGKKPWWRLW